MPFSFGELLFSKRFFILEHNSKHLSSVPNDLKLITHAINKQETDYVMACYTASYSVKNTINKLQILYTLHYFYQSNIYLDKQDIIGELFYQ